MSVFEKGIARAVVILAMVISSQVQAQAHDHWISREQRRSATGEWCCSEADCAPVPDEKVRVTPRGYVLEETGETIPTRSAQPSGDGRYWRCRRPDATTRCFFFPPPGT